ncbi:hypothetical protein Patl1_18424 [Pistacia atlantica]|uniref:Uncharacterized protein n=1 Tax=Pistacia atlantica TaxID=434234 RepID=A0ACC1BZT0_9ROSI|nr:hypothetical protein Patl1_18424 [Pistacia atlantica]
MFRQTSLNWLAISLNLTSSLNFNRIFITPNSNPSQTFLGIQPLKPLENLLYKSHSRTKPSGSTLVTKKPNPNRRVQTLWRTQSITEAFDGGPGESTRRRSGILTGEDHVSGWGLLTPPLKPPEPTIERPSSYAAQKLSFNFPLEAGKCDSGAEAGKCDTRVEASACERKRKRKGENEEEEKKQMKAVKTESVETVKDSPWTPSSFRALWDMELEGDVKGIFNVPLLSPLSPHPPLGYPQLMVL